MPCRRSARFRSTFTSWGCRRWPWARTNSTVRGASAHCCSNAGVKLAASAFGGHQESGRRPGTEVVPLIAGMAKALELFQAEPEQRHRAHPRAARPARTAAGGACPPVVLNGSREQRLPNTLNVAFPGVDGEALLVALDLEGMACSLGSTCASGSAEPAPVLLAMNRPREVWHSSVRFSVGIETTDERDRTGRREDCRYRQPAPRAVQRQTRDECR